MIDLNHGSQVVYGASQEEPITGRINTLIDCALVDRNRQQRPRTYLGGSRITVCGCHSSALAISAMVAPSGCLSMAIS